MWIADRPKKKQEEEDLATRDGLSAMRRCMGARVHDSTYTCMMYAHVQVSTASERAPSSIAHDDKRPAVRRYRETARRSPSRRERPSAHARIQADQLAPLMDQPGRRPSILSWHAEEDPPVGQTGLKLSMRSGLQKIYQHLSKVIMGGSIGGTDGAQAPSCLP